MSALDRTAVVLAIAALVWPAQIVIAADPIALGPFITLTVDSGDGALTPLSHKEIDIDKSMIVGWDEAALRAVLADPTGPRQSMTAQRRLETLHDLVARFLDTQSALDDLKAMSPGGQINAAAVEAASQRFGEIAQPALEKAIAYDQALREDGEIAAADALQAAILEDYAALAEVVRGQIQDLGERVDKALARGTKASMQMRAKLVSTTGSRRLHLDGYDEIDVFAPRETPRFQLVLDERAHQEVAAAEALRDLVEQAASGELRENLESAWEALGDELERLTDAIQEDVLRANIETVVDQLGASGEARLEGLAAEGQQLLASLDALELDALHETPEDAQLLIKLIGNVNTQISGAIAGLRTLGTRLDGFTGEITTALQDLPGTIEAGALAQLNQSMATFKANADVSAVVTAFGQVRSAFGLVAEIAGDVLDAAAEIPRDALTQDLDTRLDLLTAGERHSGELIILEAELSKGEGDDRTVVARNFQRIRVRKFGLSVGPRGTLLFTDPKEEALADQDWEPSPAVAFMAHYGKRGSRAWNDVFDPGIGIALTMLDHTDEDDVEVGLAATVSLFRSLIWVGYGRNLQAESEFFHVGVNPLVIGSLWKERGGVAALP